MPAGQSRSRHLQLCLLVVLAGLAVRVFGICALDLWGDEAFSWLQSNGSLSDVLARTAKDNYPPLHNIILHYTMALLGDSEIALRAPSVLMGTLTIFVVFLTGKAMWDWRTGLIAALLLAFSPIHIWHSIEARMYALFCLASLLYLASTFRFLRTDSHSSMLACIASGVLMLYSHVFGSFVFVAVNAAVLANALLAIAEVKPRLSKWMLAQLAAAVAFLPWLLVLAWRTMSASDPGQLGMSWIPAPTPGYLVEVVMQLLGGPFVVAVLLTVGCIALRRSRVSAADTLLRDPAREKHRLALLLCAFSIAVPALIAFCISLAFTPLVLSRYLISTLPVALLLSAWLISRTFASTRAVLVTVAAMLLGIVVILPQIAGSGWLRPVKADLARFQQLRSEGDRVLYLGWDWPLFTYYVRDRRGIEMRIAPDLPKQDDKAGRIWLVNLNGTGGQDWADGLKASGYREMYHATTPLILFSLFER